jgi:hypothetical protein
MNDALPMRLTTAEVCALARCSEITLWRRRKQDPTWLPVSKHKYGRENVFDREAVVKALGLQQDEQPHTEAAGWEVDAVAIREARTRTVRHGARAAGGRDVPRPVRDPHKAPAVRLVADNAATPKRGT